MVACGLKLPESLPVEKRKPLHLRATLKDYATVGSDPRFLLQSLAIALAASALFIYISAAPVFVLKILRLSETSFAWLFIPMITGIMAGSLAAGRVANFWRPERTIRIGFFIMTGAAVVNALYAAFFTAAIPWAVFPIMLCTFGMAFVSPAMTILTLDLYPSRRGLAASLQSAFVMGVFSICSGLVVPFMFGSALKLANRVVEYLAVRLGLRPETFSPWKLESLQIKGRKRLNELRYPLVNRPSAGCDLESPVFAEADGDGAIHLRIESYSQPERLNPNQSPVQTMTIAPRTTQ